MTIAENFELADHKVKLFCLPFAGGSSYAYREFEQHISDFITVRFIDFPGHGKRMREPLLTNIHEMADDIFYQIRDDLNEPYAIYGHSLGATVSYLLSKKIVGKDMPNQPFHLFLSGRAAPSVKKEDRTFHLLPKEEFIDKVAEYGGIPELVLQEKELMDFFEPILRADFQAVETYKYEKTDLLDIPITALIGLNEKVTYDEALKWRETTTRDVSVKQFTGGHFFIFEHLAEIGRIISQTLMIIDN